MSEIEKITEFLKNCNTCYLATADEEGNPHVRLVRHRSLKATFISRRVLENR